MGFLSSLFIMLKDFVTSKKVLTAVATAIVSSLVSDPEQSKHIIEIGAVLLAGQGLADHGKAAAQVKANAPAPNVAPNAGP